MEMLEFAEKLKGKVEDAGLGCIYNNQYCKTTVSIGVASEIITKETTIEQITKKADIAVFKAKENGRNRVEVYSR